MTFPSTVRQMAVIAFIALVTGGVLAMLVARSHGPAEVLVYGVTAAFGIEFLMASWPALWSGPRRPS